ncbi:HD domain-containing protein [soil metagenome]
MNLAGFSPLLEEAIELSAQWHDGTYRKNRWRDTPFDPPIEVVLRIPVMAHVTAVAMTVQRAGWEDTVVAAAFLHDVLEDPNRYGSRLRTERLSQLMGEEVTALVEAVSEPRADDDGRHLSWQERKDAYLARLAAAPDGAVAISFADKVHNLWTMNRSLKAGVNIFENGPGRKGLSAGPERQQWFFSSVFKLADARTDERLSHLRHDLSTELQRFERLAQ